MKRMVGIESPSKRDTPSQTTEGPHLLNTETAINADYSILQVKDSKNTLKTNFLLLRRLLISPFGGGAILETGYHSVAHAGKELTV